MANLVNNFVDDVDTNRVYEGPDEQIDETYGRFSDDGVSGSD